MISFNDCLEYKISKVELMYLVSLWSTYLHTVPYYTTYKNIIRQKDLLRAQKEATALLFLMLQMVFILEKRTTSANDSDTKKYGLHCATSYMPYTSLYHTSTVLETLLSYVVVSYIGRSVYKLFTLSLFSPILTHNFPLHHSRIFLPAL